MAGVDFEKLGVFYLGRVFDLDAKTARPEPLLYDSKDLTTHAVCVGMTGSGKTGLCLSLLEEAALDGIPAIAIDPKGDLGNLLLTFPELRPEDFRPWIDESEAARKGRSVDEEAAAVAKTWRDGLAEWGQEPDRIARLRAAADFAVYTPGSSAGLSLSVLRSLDAPPADLVADPDSLRERVGAVVSGLLALLGIEGDPLRSREHVLLATIVDRAWREGQGIDLAGLIRQIQTPPFDRVGVLDLESFFPAKDRAALAGAVNAILAAPGFAGWMEGEPLDVARLFRTPEGKPRVSILSIAHLSDAERMFFVTLLLGEVLTWMRAQPGTPSLRAILYMDEIFGFFPPTANPPSKTPMLTLLKQARAYGLGIVLATQNPVDLDYKGLANTGTWFLGRLQTERDKARVLDGLEGASAASGRSFDRARIETILSGLAQRVFVMNDVHEDEPVAFQSRWALSYLRGPLTRAQIASLMAERKQAPRPSAASAPKASAAAPAAGGSERPVVGAGVTELFVASRAPRDREVAYRPALCGAARVRLGDAWSTLHFLGPLDASALADPWSTAEALEAEPDLETEPATRARFAELPAEASRAKSYEPWAKALADHLYRTSSITIHECAELKESSNPGESEADFRVRLGQRLRERRDAEVAKLEKSYAPKLATLADRIRRAEERVGREQSQYSQQKLQTAVSLGATVLGALFGRKMGGVGTIGRATTAARGVGRAAQEREDVARANESVEELRGRLAELERELQAELDRVRANVDPTSLTLSERALRPKKADIQVTRVALAWVPE
jgi:hypothetical protein